jgi:hypothetical protein
MRQSEGEWPSNVADLPLRSLALPLDKGFVLPTHSVHALTVFAEFHANYMLAMASITARSTSVCICGNREIEHVHKTIVVRSDD